MAMTADRAFYPSENRPRRTFIEGYNFTSKTGNDSYCSMATDETGSSWIFSGDPVSRQEDHSAVELSDGCFSNRTKIFLFYFFFPSYFGDISFGNVFS